MFHLFIQFRLMIFLSLQQTGIWCLCTIPQTTDGLGMTLIYLLHQCEPNWMKPVVTLIWNLITIKYIIVQNMLCVSGMWSKNTDLTIQSCVELGNVSVLSLRSLLYQSAHKTSKKKAFQSSKEFQTESHAWLKYCRYENHTELCEQKHFYWPTHHSNTQA